MKTVVGWEALSAVGRPIAGPPGIPADRLAFLRDAFAKAVADEEFLWQRPKRQSVRLITHLVMKWTELQKRQLTCLMMSERCLFLQSAVSSRPR